MARACLISTPEPRQKTSMQRQAPRRQRELSTGDRVGMALSWAPSQDQFPRYGGSTYLFAASEFLMRMAAVSHSNRSPANRCARQPSRNDSVGATCDSDLIRRIDILIRCF